MKNIFEYIIENCHAVKELETSAQGYPIFQFGIPHSKAEDVKSYGAYYTALFGHGGGNGFYTTQLVFYSEKEDVINQFQQLILAKRKTKNSEQSIADLKQFFNKHKSCFIDINKKPIKKLDYWESRIYHELSDCARYQEIQQKSDIGVCYLIRDDKLYTFRTPTQWVSPDNPALKGYYTKPIHTKEDMDKHREVVNKLFDAGKLTYEVMLSGRTAKACIDNILAQEAKLPNSYEYEQLCILENYAKLQNYPIKTSVDKKGRHTAQLTTYYGVVNVVVAEKANSSLVVSYEDKKNVKMDLTEFVDKFYYDKTKDKVNDLVKKFKR